MLSYLLTFIAGGAAYWAFARYVWPKIAGHI